MQIKKEGFFGYSNYTVVDANSTKSLIFNYSPDSDAYKLLVDGLYQKLDFSYTFRFQSVEYMYQLKTYAECFEPKCFWEKGSSPPYILLHGGATAGGMYQYPYQVPYDLLAFVLFSVSVWMLYSFGRFIRGHFDFLGSFVLEKSSQLNQVKYESLKTVSVKV